MIKLLGLGGLLTAVVTGIFAGVWGREAVIAGVTFGVLATVVQFVAVAIVKPVMQEPLEKFAVRWVAGMALRLFGVVAMVVAVVANRDLFPPLPTAFAYLGVLIPLLFMEPRFLGDTRTSRAA